MFTVEFRDQVRARVLELAAADPRVVAGAMVGGLALGGGDRWSDLDLTFGVEGAPPVAVLDEWAATLSAELDAAALFDLPSHTALYRVFLLPGCLQVDLSCAPAADFGARGPSFALLFGEEGRPPPLEPDPPREELFGYAVHHAVRGRFCVERGRFWQAEWWISELRNLALALACRNRGLEPAHGRGYDELPAEILAGVSLPAALERHELLHALRTGLATLAGEAPDLAVPFEARLRELAS